MVEHWSEKPGVDSPILSLGTNIFNYYFDGLSTGILEQAGVVQLARTTHCQCVGRGFEPRLPLQNTYE